MPARSTTSTYMPAPPINTLPAKGGKVYTGLAFREAGVNLGVKPNMSVPPPPGVKRMPKVGNRF